MTHDEASPLTMVAARLYRLRRELSDAQRTGDRAAINEILAEFSRLSDVEKSAAEALRAPPDEEAHT
jgi:hypothetical protein